MSTSDHSNAAERPIFEWADWYDRGINWDARLGREIPVLTKLFGPPARGGLLDAGCGPGRHLAAMSAQGYRVVGLDTSPDMLAVAQRNAAAQGVTADFVAATFAEADRAGRGFDGVYCLGNSLAATGSADAAQASLTALAQVLRPDGRMFIQVLNFEKLRAEFPRVRGPRVRTHEGTEYLGTRVYAFTGDQVEVTSLTLWQASGVWRQHAGGGTLYAIGRAEMEAWCAAVGLVIDAVWGDYAGASFDPLASNDLILAAHKA